MQKFAKQGISRLMADDLVFHPDRGNWDRTPGCRIDFKDKTRFITGSGRRWRAWGSHRQTARRRRANDRHLDMGNRP